MTLLQARSHDRLRRYQPRWMRFRVGSRCLGVVVPAEQGSLSRGERAQAVGHSDEPPYWVRVWPASMAVVRALAHHDRTTRPLAHLRVLDLGCGLGLPGIVAASLGAAVTFCDREPDALVFAEWNAKRLSAACASIDTVCGDWRALRLGRRFDVIVLADVTYRTAYHEALLDQVEVCLSPGGLVLHADPERVESSDFLARLAERMPVATEHRPILLGGKRVTVRLAVAGTAPRSVPAVAAQFAPERE